MLSFRFYLLDMHIHIMKIDHVSCCQNDFQKKEQNRMKKPIQIAVAKTTLKR